MSNDAPAWSTPKFLVIALVTAFVVAFTVNLIFNELLHLGLGTASIGAAIGVATALVATRWSVLQDRLARAKKG